MLQYHPPRFDRRPSLLHYIILIVVSFVIATAALPSFAMWILPTEMPVSRLLKNVEGYVRKHPKDAAGYYTLGRIQSATFALAVGKLRAYKESDHPGLPEIMESTHEPRDAKRPTQDHDLEMLESSLGNYKRSTELDPKRGESWFGLGFETEEAMRYPLAYTTTIKMLSLTTSQDSSYDQVRELLRQSALASYRLAYSLTITGDMKPGMARELVSKEAADSITRLQQGRKLADNEQAEISLLQEKVKELKSVNRMYTPILIDLRASSDLQALLEPNNHVKFDLSGENPNEVWPWVKPATGILVWDPHHTGKITSGLQLFGNITWWLFWQDGYGPLAALDNDHNGWLEGKELDGIAVWFDRNSNGVSDPSEVVSLKTLGIRRIAVTASGRNGGVPFNLRGVQFANGSYAATYDWMPTPIDSSVPSN